MGKNTRKLREQKNKTNIKKNFKIYWKWTHIKEKFGLVSVLCLLVLIKSMKKPLAKIKTMNEWKKT